MKTKKQQAQQQIEQTIGYKIASALDLDVYTWNDIWDWSGCYYEGDTPTLKVYVLAERINKIIE